MLVALLSSNKTACLLFSDGESHTESSTLIQWDQDLGVLMLNFTGFSICADSIIFNCPKVICILE